jgi:Domain of unknown function (DUF1707)
VTTDVTHRLRASDAEREQVATIVRAAMTEGRLTLDEGEERLATVYAARFRDELAPCTADLPDGGRHALADTPGAQAAARRQVRRHAGFVVAVALLLTALWGLSGAIFFWPAIPLTFLVMGLARQARWSHHPQGGPWQHHGYGGPYRDRW